MRYVYILKSKTHPNKIYIGSTNNLKRRLLEHNQGKSKHTQKFCPWQIESAIYFSDEKKAYAFERYLKHGSGYAFLKKRLV